MKKYLLPEEGTFYKANLHSHSTISDGKNTPEEMKNYYKAHGYQILALTDHELLVDHSDLNDPDFLMLTGYEYAISTDTPYRYSSTIELNIYPRDPHNVVQVCFNPKNGIHGEKWRCETVSYRGEIYQREFTLECAQHVIDEARANDCIVSLNHPAYSGITPDFFGQLQGLFGLEIHNQGALYLCGDFSPQMYDRMLHMGHRISPLAADDNHEAMVYDDPVDLRPWGFNVIKAPALTHEAVVAAMERGDLYASQGPLFQELYIEDGTLHVACDGVKAIVLRTKNRFYQERHAPVGEVLTKAEFPVPDDEYLWVQIIDGHGRHAYTRGYFRDELA